MFISRFCNCKEEDSVVTFLMVTRGCYFTILGCYAELKIFIRLGNCVVSQLCGILSTRLFPRNYFQFSI